MADIYVKANAGGSNNGTSWANAYTTMGAVLAAASAGDVVYIAPGWYDEVSLSPTNAGSSSEWIDYIGDPTESIVDGSSATHGCGAGYVIIGDKDYWGNYYLNEVISVSNNWKYHRMFNLFFYGNNTGQFCPVTDGMAGQIELTDCVFLSNGIHSPVSLSFWSLDSGKTYIGKMTRCLTFALNQGQYGSTASIYFCAKKSSGFNANPDYIAVDCMFIGRNHALYDNGVVKLEGSDGYYTYVQFDNCSFVNVTATAMSINTPTPAYAIKSNGSTFAKVSVSRCYAHGVFESSPTNQVTIASSSENKVFGNNEGSPPSGWAVVDCPMLPAIPRLIPSAGNFVNPLIDASTYATAGTDLFGTVTPVGTYRDAGAEEQDPAKYVLPPTMILPTGGGSPTGGCNILGGSIIRRA